MNFHDREMRIVLERERLVARCASQRTECAALAQQFERPLRIADRVMGTIRYFRTHPALLGAAVALLVVVQRRGMWGWVRRGYALWRAYRAFGNAKLGA